MSNWFPGPRDHGPVFGRQFLKSPHRLAETGLFDDDALARLIDAYPRHRLLAFATGTDPTNMRELVPVDTAGVSGADVIEALQRGRLWFKLLRIQEWAGPYADVVDRLYRELEAMAGGFRALTKNAVLFFGSTGSQVYYHFDAKPNMLWHIRGRKRFWLYPALNTDLVSQKALEDVYTMTTDEEVPYDPKFDAYAAEFDLGPGDVLSWPQNSPHRVLVTEGMSVSLGTLHDTADSLRRSHVICANAMLRQVGFGNLSMAERGPMPAAKEFLYRAARKTGATRPRPIKPYVTSLVIDPASGVRVLSEPRLTEFARGPA